MCRDDNHGGRRCPADTSEARQLRRKNAVARQMYATKTVTPIEGHFLPEITEHFTVDMVKQDIADISAISYELASFDATPEEAQIAYDKHLNRIGAGIEYLAEHEFGALPDEDMLAAHLLREEEIRAKYQQKIDAAQSEVDEATKDLDAVLTVLHRIADEESHPDPAARKDAWFEVSPSVTIMENKIGLRIVDNKLIVIRSEMEMEEEVRASERELIGQRNEAMKSALEAVGVKFASPENLTVSPNSDPESLADLRQAISYFPSNWVENSNASNALVVIKEDERAYYQHEVGEYLEYSDVNVEIKPVGWSPEPNSMDAVECSPLSETGTWDDPVSGITFPFSAIREEGENSWVRLRHDFKSEPDEGYEPVQIRGDGMEQPVTMYAKPMIRRRELATAVKKSELAISQEPFPVVGGKGFRAAIHEFSHRVERTTPRITAYEQAFLKRRAGHFSSGAPESISVIGDSENEVGYKDNFISHYMGRVYGSEATEILSTGMETLWGGQYGGFAGTNGYKADPDHKRFILGILASSAKRK